MSSHHHHHGVLDALKSAATVVKKSPGMLRKKFNGKKQMGESKDYSTLEDCRENGWLHTDDAIRLGIEYNVKYLGSVEIDYVPGSPSENNALAIKTMRYLKKSASKDSIQTLKLTISVGRISLTSPDHTKIVMRHSTSRIAYSTVDHEHPKHFCYVALPKTSSMPLLHMFITKSAKTSYELTFTCAQAFDANYKQWQANRAVAETKSMASESGDVEPSRAHRSPLVQRKAMNSSPAPTQQHSIKKPSPLHGSSSLAVPDSTEGGASGTVSPTPWQAGDRVASADTDQEIAASLVPFSLLEVDDDETDADKYFSTLSAAKSTPNMLDIGVDPEDFNKAKDDYIDIEGVEDD